jgi:ATP-dependent Clp protease ATP-binding subunit ClpA
VEAYSKGTLNDSFDSNILMPILRHHFRTEFLNRFDAIIVFNPLSIEDLLKVAQLEIKKVEKRAAAHAVKFNIDPEVLRSRITKLVDYRIGARPVKRFIEQTCEALIAKKILSKAKQKK